MPKIHRKEEHFSTQPIPDVIRKTPTINSLAKEVLRLQLQVDELRGELQEVLSTIDSDHSCNTRNGQPSISTSLEEDAVRLDRERTAATDDKDTDQGNSFSQGQLFS